MIPFDYQPRTRIVFGANTLDSLGELAAELGARRALVVSDPGVVQAGHTERGMVALRRAGIETHCFSAVHENPTTRDVDATLRTAQDFKPELLIGLGGGSSMDCAKGCNFLYTNGGSMQDYWGVGKARQPMLPMMAVPTTAGTGSEAQSFALISDADTKVKMACGDQKAACRVALLDPCLTVTQPARVTALTGIDAVAHALETYVTKPRNPVSLAFSREAWHLLSRNFARVLQDPQDLEARSGMQMGACFAGLAIENSMLGATHALANPLTADYGIVHGEAIGIMLPHVIRFNAEQVGGWYRALMEVTAGVNGAPQSSANVDGLVTLVEQLVGQAQLAQTLSECGVEAERLPTLAAAAAQQWTGRFNPREVGEQDLLELYQRAF
jgi:alcohol dehydrogenase